MNSKRILRALFSALIIGASVAGLLNVMSDNSEVQQAAKKVGCDGEDCPLRREDRYPFWQTFLLQSKKGSTAVTCTRSLYLVGDWTCRKD